MVKLYELGPYRLWLGVFLLYGGSWLFISLKRWYWLGGFGVALGWFLLMAPIPW